LEDHEIACDPSDSLDVGRWLERALMVLSPDDKALVTLFELEGWSIGELARMHGIPEGTVKSRLSRARTKMRKGISGHLSQMAKEIPTEGGRICVAGKPNAD
jgi:RNA polymerase sigma-70 factor (ECF subfamily)